MIAEIRDLGAFVELRGKATRNLGAVITEQQMASLQEEAKLSIGFDPTTKEGLATAGLPSTGRVAVQLENDSQLWALPIVDAKKFSATLDKVAKARFAVDEQKQETIHGQQVTVLNTSFGPDKILVMAYATPKNQLRGLGLVGVGKQGKALIEKALALKPQDNITTQAEYQAQSAALNPKFVARVISPAGPQALKIVFEQLSGFRMLRSLRTIMQHPLWSRAKSVGFAADFDHPRGGRVNGRVRLDAQGLTLAKKILAQRKSSPAGISALNIDPSVLFAQFSGDPKALTDLLFSPQNPQSGQLNATFTRVNMMAGTDVKKTVLPMLTGDLALSAGLGDLSQVAFKRMMGNPMSVLWLATAVGVKSPEEMVQLQASLEPRLNVFGLSSAERSVGPIKIRTLKRGGAAALFESMPLDGTFVLSQEPIVTNEIAGNKKAQDLLKGRAGFAVQLRLDRLTKQLQSFKISTLPLLMRGAATEILKLVGLFGTAELRILPAPDGLSIESSLSLGTPAS